MIKKEILDFNSFASFVEGENVNMVYTRPLAFYSPTVSNGSLKITDHGMPVSYAADITTLDKPENAGTYIINQDNCIVFLTAKDQIPSECQAKAFLVGFVVSYVTPTIIYSTPAPTATYNMVVKRGKDGVFVTAYSQNSLKGVMETIPQLDASLDINMTGGYVYEIFRDLTTCKK